jgi:hypothetical protein
MSWLNGLSNKAPKGPLLDRPGIVIPAIELGIEIIAMVYSL